MRSAVVAFDEGAHRESTVLALAAVRRSGNAYPLPSDSGDSLAELGEWLFEDRVLQRWVAVDGSGVVGHVCVGLARDYLARRIRPRAAGRPVLEISKLFVRPEARGAGWGRRLLAEALAWNGSQGASTALAVLPASQSAIDLYREVGLVQVGSFVGTQGVNLVFVDDPEALTFSEHPAVGEPLA